ncbi:hypothetical protein LCGC14_1395940 [marine sediment metagenome]|uniref:Uncharacterized protein n=1 Tax=marine sediment metagenome TaxID=412755 RepID=A0A0F9KJI0_9ZZZZ
MSVTHILTAADYAAYEKAVDRFFTDEKVENLSTGHLYCPDCGSADDQEHIDKFLESEKCPDCETSRNCWDEPSFSWTRCDCCDRDLGGDRYHATGYNRQADQIQEYSICVDCMYYAEYGRLDDQAMLDIEDNERGS